jgi:hypothetical protein
MPTLIREVEHLIFLGVSITPTYYPTETGNADLTSKTVKFLEEN